MGGAKMGSRVGSVKTETDALKGGLIGAMLQTKPRTQGLGCRVPEEP